MKCLLCGQNIDENAVECPFCGAQINDYEDSMYQSFSECDWSDKSVILTRLISGEKKTITEFPSVIGRSIQCDITIKGNPTIGRTHLEINKVGDSIFIRDLGSKNHTYVNGERIEDIYVVYGPTRLRLADEEFLIEIKNS